MADKIYKGKNIRIIISGKKIFHATEGSISITTNLESIATKDTDGNIQTPSNYEWTASANALVAQVDPAGTHAASHSSFTDLVAAQLANSELDFQFTTEATGDFIFSGKVYITQCDITASTENAATGSFSFTGNGNLTLDTVEEDEG